MSNSYKIIMLLIQYFLFSFNILIFSDFYTHPISNLLNYISFTFLFQKSCFYQQVQRSGHHLWLQFCSVLNESLREHCMSSLRIVKLGPCKSAKTERLMDLSSIIDIINNISTLWFLRDLIAIIRFQHIYIDTYGTSGSSNIKYTAV